jgi:hypothetical protein
MITGHVLAVRLPPDHADGLLVGADYPSVLVRATDEPDHHLSVRGDSSSQCGVGCYPLLMVSAGWWSGALPVSCTGAPGT